MIKHEQIPPEVADAATRKYAEIWHNNRNDEDAWEQVIAAGLAAWPGMEYWPEFSDAGLGEHEPGKVFLPLPTEARDD